MEYPQEIELYNKFGSVKIRSWLPFRLSKHQIAELISHFNECFQGKTRSFTCEINLLKPEIPKGVYIGIVGITSDEVPVALGSGINDSDLMNLVKKIISTTAFITENVLPYPDKVAEWLEKMGSVQAEADAKTLIRRQPNRPWLPHRCISRLLRISRKLSSNR